MIDTQTLQVALRTRVLTLSVATCSGVNLSATGSVFTRASGSFLTDSFSPGMEVLGAGFSVAANNARFTVTAVTALTMTVSGSLSTESAAAGKTLTVGLPAGRAWENIAYEATTSAPWVEEQLIPAGSRQITVGPLGTLETRLLYQLQVHVPEDVGIGAPNRYADSLLTLFTPRTAITFGSDTARVRTDTGPYRGQLLRRRPGFATVPVTFPLEIRSDNTT
jgi:hypothetical protein